MKLPIITARDEKHLKQLLLTYANAERIMQMEKCSLRTAQRYLSIYGNNRIRCPGHRIQRVIYCPWPRLPYTRGRPGNWQFRRHSYQSYYARRRWHKA